MNSTFFDKKQETTPIDNIFITKLHIKPTKNGVLDHLTFAVKDVIDIQGQKTSCGNPTWLSTHSAANSNADCITQLLSNGAECIGKTVLGEFCSGSTGVNHFYGMSPNPKAPDRVPGGSSSGSASAVASGIVDFALGTDTAGSMRLPASFCGIYGLRPSYGAISMKGVISFAPSFDTLGIFSKSIDTLQQVYEVLIGKPDTNEIIKTDKFYVIQDYLMLVSDEQQKIFHEFIIDTCNTLGLQPIYIKLTDIDADADDKELGISIVFKRLLCAEIWKSLGDWIKEVGLEFSKTTYVDFSYMVSIDKAILPEMLKRREIYSEKLRNLLRPGSLLCIPTTPDVAPVRNEEYKQVNKFDYDKLRPLISLASIAGLPQMNIPIETKGAPPVGVSLLSGYNQDLFLINVAKKVFDNKKKLQEKMSPKR